MRLRQQDVDNKTLSKNQIKKIRQSKPKIIRTPRKKWIPVVIEPKGAALNAKFYKGKPKPSIEFERRAHKRSIAKMK